MVLVDTLPLIETNGYKGWLLFLVFIAGLIIGGPFHNYFIEHFNRKKVCTVSYIGIALSVAIFLFSIQIVPTFFALAFLGLSFGLSTASSITVTIDVTSPTNRNQGNIIYACMGRLGMIVGIPTAIIVFSEFGSRSVLYISLSAILMAWVLIKITKHPFRAPLETSKISWDRFILPKSWKMILMMTCIAFILGAILPHLIQLLTAYAHKDVNIQFKLVAIPFLIFALSISISILEIYYLLRKQKYVFIALRSIILVFVLVLFFTSFHELSFAANTVLILIFLEGVFAIYKIGRAQAQDTYYNKWDFESKYKLEVVVPILSGLLFILLAHLAFTGTNGSFEQYIMRPFVHLILLFGIARVSTPVFVLLVLSARHCERGTANTSHQLAWEIGITLGALVTTALQLNTQEIIHVNLVAFSICVFSFIYIFYRLSKLIAEQKYKEE